MTFGSFRSPRAVLILGIGMLALSATATSFASTATSHHSYAGYAANKKASAKLRAFTAAGDAGVPLPSQPITDPANQPIASLDLPAGSYIINAKAFMHISVPTDTVPANNVTCTLQAGQDTDFIQFDLFAPKIGDDGIATSTITHKFSQPGTVTWRCNQPSPGVTVLALNRKLTALQVSSISQTQLP